MLVNVVAPPPQVGAVHSELRERLEEHMRERGYRLTLANNNPDVPAVVTAVNSSRVISDIRRDLLRVRGSFGPVNEINTFTIPDPSVKKIVVAIITDKGSSCTFDDLEEIQDQRVVGAEYIFVDSTFRHVLDSNQVG